MKTQKKILKLFLLIYFFSCIGNRANSQSSFTGHTGFTPSTDWCGWNSGSFIPFDIRHNGPYSIDFYTDSIFRMIIDPTGFVGIGTTSPQNIFNINGDSLGTGDVFRTDAQADQTWHMFDSLNEVFSITNYEVGFPLKNDIWMSVPMGSFNTYTNKHPITYTTGSTAHVLEIFDDSVTTPQRPFNAGYVGIGDYDYYSYPQSYSPLSVV